MRKDLTRRQMINAELASRARNKKSVRVLNRFFPARVKEEVKIKFICECADPDCAEQLPLTLKEYQQLHQNYAHFIVAKGHTAATIEEVKKSTKNLFVVEKPDLKKSIS